MKQGEFFAEQLLQAAHEPYRIPVPSRAAVVLPSPSEFSSSCGKPWYLCTCAGATSLSPVAAGNQVLALSLVAFVSHGTNLPDTWRQACVYVGRILKGEKPPELPGCAAYQVRTGNKSQNGKTTRHRGPANPAQPRRRGDRVRQNLCSARVRLWATNGHRDAGKGCVQYSSQPFIECYYPISAASRYGRRRGRYR
jgi:hypothetical protein